MMKGLCTLIVFSVLSTNVFAKANCAHSNFEENLEQLAEVTAEVDNCPKPTPNQFNKLCMQVESQNSAFDQTLNEVSCVKRGDGETTKKEKIQHMWAKHRNLFKCNAEGFNLKNGNVVKMSVASNFMPFLDGLVKDYDIDINFQDPADGKNVLDFTKDEIDRLKQSGGQSERVAELESIYDYLKSELKAKHTESYASK